MSIITNFSTLWKSFVRPPRQNYKDSDLGKLIIFYLKGPRDVYFTNYVSRRHDFQLKNKRNLNIKCTLYEPVKINALQKNEDIQKPFPCVIYCHCNSGGRVEAFYNLKTLLSRGIGLFALDFAGSGHSDGEYISLGKYEVDDV